MPIEATIILLDNSEYARNGDLEPSRWQQEIEALQLVTEAKISSSMENGVGVILSGGRQVQLLQTPTNDSNSVVGCCDKIKLQGNIHFSISLQQAQLALKHRINKKQQQRITAFVASPVEDSDEQLVKIAKLMKKNNIAVDIINFGEQNESHLMKIKLFHENVDKDNNSSLINLKPGLSQIYEALITLIQNQQGGQDGQVGNQGQQNLFNNFDNPDPNMDPELAEAIKLSLMEQQNQTQGQNQPETFIDEQMDEEELLKKAKEMSLIPEQPASPKEKLANIFEGAKAQEQQDQEKLEVYQDEDQEKQGLLQEQKAEGEVQEKQKEEKEEDAKEFLEDILGDDDENQKLIKKPDDDK
ncbi:hypothetical protein pb186bvf_005917 [Paramecium bursaria]